MKGEMKMDTETKIIYGAILELLERIEKGQRAIIDGLGMICHNQSFGEGASNKYPQFGADELLPIEKEENKA